MRDFDLVAEVGQVQDASRDQAWRRRCVLARGGPVSYPCLDAGEKKSTEGTRWDRRKRTGLTTKALVRRPRLHLSEHPALPVGGGDRGVVREERRAPRLGADTAEDVGAVEGVVRRPALAQLQGQDGRGGGHDPRAPGRVLAAMISRPPSLEAACHCLACDYHRGSSVIQRGRSDGH